MQTIRQFTMKTVSLFWALCLLFSGLSHADNEPARFDSRSGILTLPTLVVDSGEWYANTEIWFNLSTGEFAISGIGKPIAVADGVSYAFYVTDHQLLVIPVLSIDDSQWYKNVKLLFDFATSTFEVFDAEKISAPSVDDISGDWGGLLNNTTFPSKFSFFISITQTGKNVSGLTGMPTSANGGAYWVGAIGNFEGTFSGDVLTITFEDKSCSGSSYSGTGKLLENNRQMNIEYSGHDCDGYSYNATGILDKHL